MSLKKLYAEITKSEPQDDGTIKVWGYASSEAVDADGETIKASAIKAALPDYMKFGAVREMHQQSAAGTAIEAAVEDDGRTFFGAHVVDPIAVKKVQTGVYKGFSIGGRVLKRDSVDKNLITGLRLIEVSLVDRPANPEAVFTCYKAEALNADLSDTEAIDEMARVLDDKEATPQLFLKALKAYIPPETVPPRATIKPAEVKKGMSGLCRFAELIQSLAWLTMDTADEASWEGDNSPLPDQLRDWLATGIMIFETMATEEADELLAALTPKAAAEKSDAAPVPECDGSQPAGETDPVAKATEAAPVTAADPVAADALAKTEVLTLDAVEALVKAAVEKASEPLSALRKMVNDLNAELVTLKKSPAPGKAFLKAISKGDDIEPVATAAQQKAEALSKSDNPLDLIKAVHANGGIALSFNP